MVKMIPESTLFLASQSPRRRRMMTWLDVPFQVTHADVNEQPRINEAPCDLASRLAIKKAEVAHAKTQKGWVLAADTIVDFNQSALGKPRDATQAQSMLQMLRGHMHQVHTGLTLIYSSSDRAITFRVSTDVWMRNYSDEEIEAYIATGDPMDKAGAYAIQNTGFHPVDRLDRCYANVVGLPLCSVVAVLSAANVHITKNIPDLCLSHFGYNCPQRDKGKQI